MSYRFYVGNYPTEFSQQDLLELFKDFNDIKLEKMFKKDLKSFSFFECTDINVLVLIIKKLNNSVVAGRNLKVRATDKNLQDYISVLLENNDDVIEPEVPSLAQPEERTKNKFLLKSEDRDIVQQQVKKDSYASRSKTRWITSEHDEYYSRSPSSSKSHGSLVDECNASLASDEHDTERFSYIHARNLSQQYKHPDLEWISLSNFPFHTSVSSIYKLFSDYNPVKVTMVCNNPSKIGALTNALVGFEDRKMADDVIMTFDNTIFRGRVILVNDAQDSTILDDLLECFEENK